MSVEVRVDALQLTTRNTGRTKILRIECVYPSTVADTYAAVGIRMDTVSFFAFGTGSLTEQTACRRRMKWVRYTPCQLPTNYFPDHHQRHIVSSGHGCDFIPSAGSMERYPSLSSSLCPYPQSDSQESSNPSPPSSDSCGYTLS